MGAAALAPACRSRGDRALILRLSHSMTAGNTALHVFGDRFRQVVESMSGGEIKVRLFPSGTLGQEREVVQQLQEGLVDFMVSGTAIWGSVAPKLQVFDFPFLWTRLVPRPLRRRCDARIGSHRLPRILSSHAAACMGGLVRVPPCRHAQP